MKFYFFQHITRDALLIHQSYFYFPLSPFFITIFIFDPQHRLTYIDYVLKHLYHTDAEKKLKLLSSC